MRTAKIFSNGGSQAVRLPAEFRFEGDVVYVRRDPGTGDVVLSSQPRSNWSSFMELRKKLGPVPENFLADRAQGHEGRNPLRLHKE
jgi:antitoxin VapB